MKKINILITGGATRAYLDEIRYLTNYSTGQLASFMVESALKKGACVTYLYGEGSILPYVDKNYRKYKSIKIITVNDLMKIAMQLAKKEKYDAVIHSMAVLDYTPAKLFAGKMSSEVKVRNIRLIRTPKIINLFKKYYPEALLAGFKLEAGKSKKNLIEKALGLFKDARADIVIANDFNAIKRGNHKAFIIEKNQGKIKEIQGKENIAKAVINTVYHKLKMIR